MITFFSTLGDQFFLNMQCRGNRLGTFGHHRRPSRRVGKRRETSVNPWELSGTVGNLHFDCFFTRFRHQIGQIWSHRSIHSTNKCEISRSFIWKGSRGLVFWHFWPPPPRTCFLNRPRPWVFLTVLSHYVTLQSKAATWLRLFI